MNQVDRAGAMGVVYEAQDGERACRVALKTLRAFSSSAVTAERVEKPARLAAMLTPGFASR